jgi:hypothetical protein
VRREDQPNDPVKGDAQPKIDQQAQIRQQSVASVLRSRRQMGHENEVDRVPQHDRSQRNEEISAEAHRYLDT